MAARLLSPAVDLVREHIVIAPHHFDHLRRPVFPGDVENERFRQTILLIAQSQWPKGDSALHRSLRAGSFTLNQPFQPAMPARSMPQLKHKVST